MERSIFISYRRNDSTSEAGRLHTTLVNKFGKDAVFMDTSSIEPATQWPREIREALEEAKVLVVVIGPEWLGASDEWGYRRIDQEGDWVRLELEEAIKDKTKKLLVMLVRGAKMPPANKMPESISSLTNWQAVEIRDHYWNHDIQLVVRQLGNAARKLQGTDSSLGPYPVPPPEKPDPISEEKIKIALEGSLSGWKKVVSQLPENPGEVRIELFRGYRFKSFQQAIEFMSQVAPGCDIAIHHPRWENIWKSLKVYLTTWDIEHRISDRDIQLAKYFDKVYSDFPGTDNK
jgi:pterin-4a-carbinolamine dehydratase